MKTSFLLAGFIGLVATGLSAADSKEKITNATKQLGDKPNYSWTTRTKEGDGSPGRLSNIEGKTEKNGVTYLSFAVGGIPVEVYLKGTNGAAKAVEGWMTLDEIAQTSGTAAAVVRFLRSYKTPAAQSAELAANLKDGKEEDGVLTGELKDASFKELLLLGVRQRDGQEHRRDGGEDGGIGGSHLEQHPGDEPAAGRRSGEAERRAEEPQAKSLA